MKTCHSQHDSGPNGESRRRTVSKRSSEAPEGRVAVNGSRGAGAKRKPKTRPARESTAGMNGNGHRPPTTPARLPVQAAADSSTLDWRDMSVLVTGGTGSFGQQFVETLMRNHPPKRLIVFSRDELKQSQMRARFPDTDESPLRYFIGDVRDKERLYRAFRDVDVVIHAAALKQVSTGEYNPMEVIKTNILGSANIVDAAIDCRVRRVIALSTDKAVYPVNLYGATKMCADKLFLRANVYAGPSQTRFAIVRYGNVLGSRGSVLPLFRACQGTGSVPITDPRMTRFWITLEQAARFVVRSTELMEGGEIFVPRLPSTRITDLARAIAPDCDHQIIGSRPGEKIHEELLTAEECAQARETKDFFIVRPNFESGGPGADEGEKAVSGDFRYRSDRAESFLNAEELEQMVRQLDAAGC